MASRYVKAVAMVCFAFVMVVLVGCGGNNSNNVVQHVPAPAPPPPVMPEPPTLESESDTAEDGQVFGYEGLHIALANPQTLHPFPVFEHFDYRQWHVDNDNFEDWHASRFDDLLIWATSPLYNFQLILTGDYFLGSYRFFRPAHVLFTADRFYSDMPLVISSFFTESLDAALTFTQDDGTERYFHIRSIQANAGEPFYFLEEFTLRDDALDVFERVSVDYLPVNPASINLTPRHLRAGTQHLTLLREGDSFGNFVLDEIEQATVFLRNGAVYHANAIAVFSGEITVSGLLFPGFEIMRFNAFLIDDQYLNMFPILVYDQRNFWFDVRYSPAVLAHFGVDSIDEVFAHDNTPIPLTMHLNGFTMITLDSGAAHHLTDVVSVVGN